MADLVFGGALILSAHGLIRARRELPTEARMCGESSAQLRDLSSSATGRVLGTTSERACYNPTTWLA